MLLNKVVITNFGPYRDRNEFDLRTTPEEPVVLIGGKNGAGKTTFFNAIQLCFHGQSALGRRTVRREYETMIRERIHSSGSADPDVASVRIEFEYSHLGERDTYTVERRWRDRGQSIVESVKVRRNGDELSELEEDQWDDFLKELIPPGVSQLFFFDGEKVQELASAIEKDESFEDSMLSLLGLDLVKRLDADLSIYLSRKLEEEGQEELAREIKELRAELEDVEERLTETKDKLGDRRSRIRSISQKIEEKEEQLAKEGGAFAAKRDELKEKRVRLENELESIQEDIRSIVQGVYPFALVPELLRDAVDRLQQESSNKRKTAAREEIIADLDLILDDDDIREEIADLAGDPEAVVSLIESAIDERLQTEDQEPVLIDQFSEREQQRIFQVVDPALGDIPERLRGLADDLESTTRELNRVEQNISRAPEQSVISPIITKINELTEERGRLREQVDDVQSQKEELEMRVAQLEAEIDRKHEQQEELEDVSERAELASKTRKAVQVLEERLTHKKIERLEGALTDRYIQLSNKSDHYEQVLIDRDSLTAEIKTTDGGRKRQSQLSDGERQIFATSLLWALADISGRPLPFIIDTPLGRLDQEHRSNIVGRFLTSAAHQVIVLSTDTEITEDYWEMLEPAVSTTYHLDYQEEGGYTEVGHGYFGDLGPRKDATERMDEDQSSMVGTGHQDETQARLGGFDDE